jgi:hypothetical protein
VCGRHTGRKGWAAGAWRGATGPPWPRGGTALPLTFGNANPTALPPEYWTGRRNPLQASCNARGQCCRDTRSWPSWCLLPATSAGGRGWLDADRTSPQWAKQARRPPGPQPWPILLVRNCTAQHGKYTAIGPLANKRAFEYLRLSTTTGGAGPCSGRMHVQLVTQEWSLALTVRGAGVPAGARCLCADHLTHCFGLAGIMWGTLWRRQQCSSPEARLRVAAATRAQPNTSMAPACTSHRMGVMATRLIPACPELTQAPSP